MGIPRAIPAIKPRIPGAIPRLLGAGLVLALWLSGLLPVLAREGGALAELEARAQHIFEANRAAVVPVEVRPATPELRSASPTPPAATPTLGGGPQDRAYIDMLARDLDGSLRVRPDGSRFPEPASGETFTSYLSRVTEQNRRIWQRSVRRGAGVVLDASGHVAIPAQLLRHRRERDAIAVRVEGEWTGARVVGSDAFSGLAVLELERAPAAALRAGSSAEARPGQFVVGVEQPLEGGARVQWGNVATPARRLPDLESVGYVPFIETTLQILPGGVGSPVFNIEGELLGVILDGRRLELGARSYALPAWLLWQVADDLRQQGRAVHGYLGVDIRIPGREDDRQRRGELAIPDELRGILVRQVWPEGPAEKAGLLADDLILEMGGMPLADWRDLVWLVRTRRPGQPLELQLRRAGEIVSCTATMGTPPPRGR